MRRRVANVRRCGGSHCWPRCPRFGLTLLIGTYAQSAALGPSAMLDNKLRFREFLPDQLPLPHPSWRSRNWMERHPWLEADVLPVLRSCVRHALSSDPVE